MNIKFCLVFFKILYSKCLLNLELSKAFRSIMEVKQRLVRLFSDGSRCTEMNKFLLIITLKKYTLISELVSNELKIIEGPYQASYSSNYC